VGGIPSEEKGIYYRLIPQKALKLIKERGPVEKLKNSFPKLLDHRTDAFCAFQNSEKKPSKDWQKEEGGKRDELGGREEFVLR